ncbi:MAG TPA: hypothetical protein PK405_05290 [Hyphomicrobiales bacterium]|nr:hypothetical protein [Hyphomicrobiales bacterium]
MKIIALEEHFLPQHLADYWEPSVAGMPKVTYDRIKRRLFDCDTLRLEEMDAAGIDLAVLSVSGPGVQTEPDAALATSHARRANDELAGKVARHPKRLAGFAHLALQDPPMNWSAACASLAFAAP